MQMRLHRTSATAGLLLLAMASAIHAAQAPPSLQGRWVGPARVDAESAGGTRASMVLTQDGDHFAMTWSIPGRQAFEVRFEPDQERPGVYQQAGGGVLALFDRERHRDPLDGDPLFWARVDGPRLVVYRLQIDAQGGYLLDQFASERDGDHVLASLVTRSSTAPPVKQEFILDPAGGP